MNNDRSDGFWPPPYDVGYKKPPKNQQFVKGMSGNPRGRPSKKAIDPKPHVDKSTMESVLKVASREVTVRDGNSILKIPAVDAVIQTMAAAAMKGNVPAQRAFVELVDRARKDQALEIRNDHEFWRDFVATFNKYLEVLQNAGEPLPDYVPHPNDLVFEDGQVVLLRGGEPAAANQNRRLLIQFRDTLILQSEQDRRRHTVEGMPNRDTTIFMSDLMMVHINSGLPKRMQLSDGQIVLRMLNTRGLQKRALEQRLKAGWARFGFSYRSNQTTQPVRF